MSSTPGDDLLEAPGAAPLRRLRGSDGPAILDAFGSDAEMSRQGTVRTIEEARTYVTRLLEDPQAQQAWAITDDDDRLIGLIGLSIDRANLIGWLWYWMHADHRGQGRTSHAAAAVAAWALDPAGGGLERLELGHRANNPASGAVARAAGFIQEGLERGKFLINGQRIDVPTYGRLRSDPPPAPRT
ncbi:GNAT family N-acetyltransferase [Actinomyces bowdenii]|uniref:GNAT family N-acetyltransferase n=1 Tax=Actinomyces bowdenii TaxID=131109 RepID=UPI00214CB23F|nr:GNAT family protein [Actinomyces bowdenii]MCR2052491.1 GNAT family N-acetyltransferase [Actinomyces bowdenii]